VKCEKPNNDGFLGGCAVAKGDGGKEAHIGDLSHPRGVSAGNGAGATGQHSSQKRDRPAPGSFTDAKGQPTDDPEQGYYGRVERAQIEDQNALREQASAARKQPARPPAPAETAQTNPPDAGNGRATITEPAARTNGAQQAATEKQPDAVADVPDPAEKAPPAADVIDEADQAKREAVAETAQAPASVTDQPAEAADAQQIEAPPVSAAVPVPSVPVRPQGMLEGDWQRLKHRLQNQRETQRATDEAKARAGLH
jgi:hypothetical protein